jgi:hypothetical protein
MNGVESGLGDNVFALSGNEMGDQKKDTGYGIDPELIER